MIAVGAVWPQAVESLISCYSCSGDECVNGVDLGVRVDCNGVQDQCYTKFDGCKIIRMAKSAAKSNEEIVFKL